MVQFAYRESSSVFVTGVGLKSARDISNILSDQTLNTVNRHGLNELFVFFGQFLDHNIIATPLNSDKPEEFPIEVPPGDKFLSHKELPFRRSLRGLTGVADNERPINTLTSAIDLVAVYGANEPRNVELLEKTASGGLTGKLKTSPGDLLPLNTKKFNNAPDTSSRFFLAGDHRVNEHPVLTSLHTIFLREHNRLCDKIRASIPWLSGRKVYEYCTIPEGGV